MQQKLELFDVDYNVDGKHISVMFESGGKKTFIKKQTLAKWLYEKKIVSHWFKIIDCKGHMEIYVEYPNLPHEPYMLVMWLKKTPGTDEHIIRYLDSIGNFDAALALAKSQQWAERVPETLTEEQKNQWLIQHWEMFED
jgi:hypothetical protein